MIKEYTKENKDVISLLPHNQKLFDKIMGLINNGQHSIFYSEATGLGKSFIFMRLVYELFKGKKILYIVPKIAIWDNINEYEEFEYIKDYVDMVTYANFNYIKDDHYNYDALFIDECHHLASDIQGSNILKVCEDYISDNKYVFGFTATPNTSIPDVKASDFFDCEVYGMDIIEAMKSGIFKLIDYVVADDNTVVDKEYCKKYSIDSTKTILQNVLCERSDITRWLVYFSKIDDLTMNLPSIKRLFPDFKIFIMHSDNDNNDSQFKEFNSYKGKAMLLTVSMILEGVHPKNIGGIMLYRNVFSGNVLLQVLGRICDIRSTINPLCIDITNSICSADSSFIFKHETSKNSKQIKRMKSIVNVKASSYKYIELVTAMLNVMGNRHEYKGITWRTNAELSRKLGKSAPYVYKYLKKGKTYEEIIDHALNSKSINEYRGITWCNDTELSRKLGKNESYVYGCLKKGMTYEEIIDHVLGRKYRGITWSTNAELSRKLGKGKSYVSGRLRKGKTYEEIIDHILGNKYEYRGITWYTDIELSRKLGKGRSYVHGHLKRGKTYEEIIDYVLGREYRGITWLTNIELSRKLGKYDPYVYVCLKKGMTYEEIIDHVLDGKSINEYRGITWHTNVELSIKLGKNKSYVHGRLKRGKTYEEIIDHVLDSKLKEVL